MPFFKIPLLVGVPQTFTVRLTDVTYRMRVLYRNINEGGWFLDIFSEGDVPILLGAPLLPGLDLLQQYKHLNIDGELYVQTDGEPELPPTFDGLGRDSFLYYWSDT